MFLSDRTTNRDWAVCLAHRAMTIAKHCEQGLCHRINLFKKEMFVESPRCSVINRCTGRLALHISKASGAPTCSVYGADSHRALHSFLSLRKSALGRLGSHRRLRGVGFKPSWQCALLAPFVERLLLRPPCSLFRITTGQSCDLRHSRLFPLPHLPVY